MPTLLCSFKQCGKEFQAPKKSYKYCSKECHRRERYEQRKIRCKQCDKLFVRYAKRAIYCSQECSGLARRACYERICRYHGCVKPFTTRIKTKVYCNQECRINDLRRDDTLLNERLCKFCKQPFKPDRIEQKYCSKMCRLGAAGNTLPSRENLSQAMIEQRFDGYPCWKLIAYRFKVDKNRLKEYAWQNGLTDDRTLATIFAQDYGPWKAGHVAERLVWDYTGYLIETDIDGRLLKRCRVRLIPTREIASHECQGLLHTTPSLNGVEECDHRHPDARPQGGERLEAEVSAPGPGCSGDGVSGGRGLACSGGMVV